MALSAQQAEALQQLRAITASDTTAARDRDERILREVGWNVELAVNAIFSGNAEPSTQSTSGPSRSNSSTHLPGTRSPRGDDDDHEEYDSLLASSRSRGLSTGSNQPEPNSAGARQPRGNVTETGLGPAFVDGMLQGLFLSLIAPVMFVGRMFRGGWYLVVRTFFPLSLIRYLPPFLLPPTTHPATPSHRSRSNQPLDPTAATLSFIQDLSRLNLSSHTGTTPEWYIGPYREFLNTLRREGKVGMIVLCCGEHEDDEEFKRSVLGDGELIRLIREKDILVWGVDVRTREGYQVASTLLATTYPSIYFLSLLPPSSSTSALSGNSGGSPKLQILTTLAGPPSTTTSSSAIMQLITTSILPRTSAFLARLKRERLTLEEARHLREEQDRAFREAEKRDREKSRLAKVALEAENMRISKEKALMEAKELAIKHRKSWRRYARKHLLPPPPTPGTPNTIRVALRTPLDATRNTRLFLPSDSTEILYIYAETLLIPPTETPDTDPDCPPIDGYSPPEDFIIVTTFPRAVVERISVGGKEGWELVKKGGGALVAEKLPGGDWADLERRVISGEDSDEEEEIQ